MEPGSRPVGQPERNGKGEKNQKAYSADPPTLSWSGQPHSRLFISAESRGGFWEDAVMWWLLGRRSQLGPTPGADAWASLLSNITRKAMVMEFEVSKHIEST